MEGKGILFKKFANIDVFDIEIEERDPAIRKKTQDELRAIAADPVASRAYLRKTSMIDALARAEAIA